MSKKAQKAIRPYVLSVGGLAWASNYCLSIFCLIYREMFANEDIKMAINIWHGQRSDQAQLDLLCAAANGTRRISNAMRDEIIWATKQAGKLSQVRNDAIHGPTNVVINNRKLKLVPNSWSTLPSRLERLSNSKSMSRTFNVAKGDFLALVGYLFFIWNELIAPGSQSLPKRPTMRSLPK
jgi:hypothetical protein